MIKKPTVFVLGAGASCCFGYPLGVKLREDILKLETRLRETNIFPDSDEFLSAFKDSGADSIDAFLASRKKFIEVGKHAIAHCIVSAHGIGVLLFWIFRESVWYGKGISKNVCR